MKRLNIRWKLTLWYGGVLGIMLAIFSAAVFLVMRHQLLQRIDQGLAEELADVRFEVKRASDTKDLHFWLDKRFARHEGFDFQITRPNGQRFFANLRLADRALPIPESMTEKTPLTYQSLPVETAGRWRIISVMVPGPDGPLLVQVARSLASFDQECQELLFTFLWTGPLTLLIAVGGGNFLARRALAPIDRMTQAANQITADQLDRRIAVTHPGDELGALGLTFNRMLDRLERSFREMQRFTADAAHELRTPLAVMRTEAEVALRSPRSAAEFGRVLENLLEETNRLSELADRLLFLCRQDAGLQPGKREVVALDGLLREVVANMQLVGESVGVEMSLAGDSGCTVVADAGQLRRVFYNLLDNAVKYTAAGGKVTISNQAANGHISVAITDTGIGIAPEHLPRIFDRFYRADPSRTGDNGAGLGLAISQSIVKGLGGSIRVESVSGKGTTFVVTMPVCNRKADAR